MRAALAVLVLLATPGAFAQDRGDDAVRRAIAATVRIVAGAPGPASDFQGRSWGSGVIVSQSGHVVTNHHVIAQQGGQPYAAIYAGLVDPHQEFLPPTRAFRLRLVQDDPARDLALLQIVPRGQTAPTYPFLRLGRTDDVYYGTTLRLVGFPTAGGGTPTVVQTSVVGVDEQQGWIKVEGSMMRGGSGGAAINGRGELVGIPTMIQVDQEVPFFGDEDAPIGNVVIGQVGFVRSADVVRSFLSGVQAGPALDPAPGAGLAIRGSILDKQTHAPIGGAAIGFLFPGASPAPGEIGSADLVAYAKSGPGGAWQLNRAVRPGRYLVKVVHPRYQPLIQEVRVDAGQTVFDVTLTR